MHANRELYTLDQYQSILEQRWHSGLIWLAKRDSNGFPDFYFCRPVPRTVWLPGKPREKYYLRLRNKLKTQFRQSAKKYSFLTLTYCTRLYSPEEACARLKSDIKELLRRIRRRYKKIQYFYIVELTENGYPHLHIIIDKFIWWKVLKAMWGAITGSWIILIKSIPGRSVAGYLTKYLTSQKKSSDWQFAFIFKNIDRLWSSSRGFFAPAAAVISDNIFLAMSWNLHVSKRFLFRPDDDTSFWKIPTYIAMPLLADETYIDRRRSLAGQDLLYELYEYFSPALIKECFAFCDIFYHHTEGEIVLIGDEK